MPTAAALSQLVLAAALFVAGGIDLPAQEVDYLRDIKPLLAKKCYVCHGVLKQQSSLRLDTAAQIRRGGDSGPAVVPGKPDESLLIQVLTGDAGFTMPPEDQGVAAEADEIELIRRWIAAGAPLPADEQPQQDPSTFWSYKPPGRPPLPELKDRSWVRNPIDLFVAREHKNHSLRPRPPASREILLRRLYLDLVGIPPTVHQLDAFLADDSPTAYERVVDELLESPLHGQRWGRHWMDIWRYSDWYGRRPSNEIRYSMRHIWRWRDWIVDSINADRGYDQMLIDMLAGDERAPQDPSALAATGFLGRNWYKFDRNTWLFETVERTSQSLLGLTFRCARCHDHKFDPISQLDYYRMRAFFEPHDVRTDLLTIDTPTETDNGKDQVLTDGLSHIFDKQLDAPTYLFIRGDDRNPDKSEALLPGVPASLGVELSTIEPVELPLASFYPALAPALLDQRRSQSLQAIQQKQDLLPAAQRLIDQRRTELETFLASSNADPAPQPVIVLADDFEKKRDDLWEILNGTWEYTDGSLTESQVTSFATIVSRTQLPRNFEVILRYKTLEGGSYRSVGFSFDYLDKGNSQDIYTSTGDDSQSVQAFHRKDGKQHYPPEGIVKTTLTLGQEVTLRVQVRGQLLKIWLNGESKLDYQIPLPRRDGRFALWVHSGSAQFLDVSIRDLVATRLDYQQRLLEAEHALVFVRQEVEIARLENESLRARIAAEIARYSADDQQRKETTARAASLAGRRLALAKQLQRVTTARQVLALGDLQEVSEDKPAGAQSARAAALAKVEELEAEHQQLEAALQSDDVKYEPLGEIYPATSTGRRLALARWLTDPSHPRTARVAVNQIWLRHFGEALVPSVANFGLNGQQPSHPELLDWLASELVENNWQMKHLHRLMVQSATYRMDSSSGESNTNQRADPENRFLWRMNYRRMEAELVRDSILSTAGNLDLAAGGPDLDEKTGEQVLRRSIYFRLTPNDKMAFLELFDVANPDSCFRRQVSVIPQQALAISNSSLGLDQARLLARQLSHQVDDPADGVFVQAAYRQVLSRDPTPTEKQLCIEFLIEQREILESADEPRFSGRGEASVAAAADPFMRARENLVHVLYNHNDFVTIR